MPLLTTSWNPQQTGNFMGPAVDAANLLLQERARAQAELDRQAAIANEIQRQQQAQTQAMIEASQQALRRDFEFQKAEEFKNRELALREKQQAGNLGIAEREIKLRESEAAPFTLPSVSETPTTPGRGFSFGASAAGSSGTAAGSVFGLVPDGKGGWKHDPNDVTDAGVPGFSATEGKYIDSTTGKPYAIKDPTLAGAAVSPAQLKAAGIDWQDQAAVAGHEVEVTKEGKTYRLPIVDALGTPGRVDFTAKAYADLGGPMTPGGGLIKDVQYKIVPKASPAVEAIRAASEVGIPLTKKDARELFVGTTLATARAEARAAVKTGPASASEAQQMASTIAQWPKNEMGYNFNPAEPSQQYDVRVRGRNFEVTPVSPNLPTWGLKSVGENLWQDSTGAKFYRAGIKNGRPDYRPIEENEEVKIKYTTDDGRVVMLNKFGKEVGVTDPKWSFLKPNTKMLIGSDGNVYAYSVDKKGGAVPMQEVPAGVTFDQGRSTAVKKWQVGTDGKMYGFKTDGEPVTPVPEGVRFDKPKDPEAVAHYEVDEKTGNLVGVNFKGEKVAETEGDFSRLAAKTAATTAGTAKGATQKLQEGYLKLADKVHKYWAVLDQISASGADPHAPHEELMKQFGQDLGGKLSAARNVAQHEVDKAFAFGTTPGRDAAEEIVRDYERQYTPLGQPKPGAAAQTAIDVAQTQQAPAAAPATATQPNVIKMPNTENVKIGSRGKLNGVWYVKQPDGSWKKEGI